ncbi:hypothetical protein CYMTET_47720 [Cymbomonas tetramitiformis]|uniref:Protein kinase domain-containing protein n=1 Tax=Cymbomonas tetramitiformis TaxID=36881 RepID=A0AAE0BTK7_9CHLO|nr:hypothetical protein CYMTET_47720 [Cymbomonas tetramitiformis]
MSLLVHPVFPCPNVDALKKDESIECLSEREGLHSLQIVPTPVYDLPFKPSDDPFTPLDQLYTTAAPSSINFPVDHRRTIRYNRLDQLSDNKISFDPDKQVRYEVSVWQYSPLPGEPPLVRNLMQFNSLVVKIAHARFQANRRTYRAVGAHKFETAKKVLLTEIESRVPREEALGSDLCEAVTDFPSNACVDTAFVRHFRAKMLVSEKTQQGFANSSFKLGFLPTEYREMADVDYITREVSKDGDDTLVYDLFVIAVMPMYAMTVQALLDNHIRNIRGERSLATLYLESSAPAASIRLRLQIVIKTAFALKCLQDGESDSSNGRQLYFPDLKTENVTVWCLNDEMQITLIDLASLTPVGSSSTEVSYPRPSKKKTFTPDALLEVKYSPHSVLWTFACYVLRVLNMSEVDVPFMELNWQRASSRQSLLSEIDAMNSTIDKVMTTIQPSHVTASLRPMLSKMTTVDKKYVDPSIPYGTHVHYGLIIDEFSAILTSV